MLASARTRTLACVASRIKYTDGLPVACRRYWRGRLVESPTGTMDGEVIAVLRCEHRHLCDGVQLKVLWYDGLVTYHCSDAVLWSREGDRLDE